MKTLTLIPATKERNGLIVKKTINCINSSEIRKVSLSGRDNGCVAKIAGSTLNVIPTPKWQPTVNSNENLQELVNQNKQYIKEIIAQ